MRQIEDKQIRQDSPVSLFFVGVVVVAIFAAYRVFQPQLQQIGVNKTEISINARTMRTQYKIMDRNNVKINEHMLKISNSLSRIEGQLDPRISQGK
jgi:hypothetical protein